MNIIIKAVKYIFCLLSLAITLFILTQPVIDPPKGYSVLESIFVLGFLVCVLVLLGGFFVLIAERKQLIHSSVKTWLYVVFVPVVSWMDILIQPEPDGSSRIKHFVKDMYKFISYLWGYKTRVVSFVITFVMLFYLPIAPTETDRSMNIAVALIYAVFLFAVGVHFFRIACRKRFYVMNSKVLTWIYIFLVPVASWKEILLAPEPDGSRVKSVVYDSAAMLGILAKYLVGAIVFFFVGCLLVVPFFPDEGAEMTMNELVMWEAGLLAVLAVVGSPFVYIARRKKLYTNTKLLWLYVIFVPIVSWIDILLSRSKKDESMTTNG